MNKVSILEEILLEQEVPVVEQAEVLISDLLEQDVVLIKAKNSEVYFKKFRNKSVKWTKNKEKAYKFQDEDLARELSKTHLFGVGSVELTGKGCAKKALEGFILKNKNGLFFFFFSGSTSPFGQMIWGEEPYVFEDREVVEALRRYLGSDLDTYEDFERLVIQTHLGENVDDEECNCGECDCWKCCGC